MKRLISYQNKLIAEFMGFNFIESKSHYSTHESTFLESDIVASYPFYSNWNWLMPVVEKINITDDFRFTALINSMDCRIIDNINNSKVIADSFGRFAPDELIKAIYNTVVEFIEWYNKNK